MANIYCKKFRENHPNVKFEALEDENILITNCWNDDSCTFNFKKSSVLTFFNNLILHEELLAIYHIKEQLYEFIYTPLSYEFLRDCR